MEIPKAVQWQKVLYVHRLVAEAFLPEFSPELDVDHKDGNRANNLVSNLRVVTHSQNCKNYHSGRGGTSRFRGVHWYAPTSRWRAKIRSDNKDKHLGYFKCEVEAAKAFDKAAQERGFAPEAMNFG